MGRINISLTAEVLADDSYLIRYEAYAYYLLPPGQDSQMVMPVVSDGNDL